MFVKDGWKLDVTISNPSKTDLIVLLKHFRKIRI